jgi:hypothetical protein
MTAFSFWDSSLDRINQVLKFLFAWQRDSEVLFGGLERRPFALGKSADQK